MPPSRAVVGAQWNSMSDTTVLTFRLGDEVTDMTSGRAGTVVNIEMGTPPVVWVRYPDEVLRYRGADVTALNVVGGLRSGDHVNG
jgi:hypothetical protein